MPFHKVNSKLLIVNRTGKSSIYHLPFTIHSKVKRGFTLIELLIVITVFGITATLITASYLTFERNQRLKAAAEKIKSDIRFVQNEALSGNKGTGADCVTPSTLVGYYMKLSSASGENTSYTISGDCRVTTGSDPCPPGGTETSFNQKVISLPTGVKINKITYILDRGSANILFQPLAHNVTFWETNLTPPSLYGAFLNNSCQLDASKVFGNALPQSNTDVLTIELIRENTTYQVIILPSGEVNEKKP